MGSSKDQSVRRNVPSARAGSARDLAIIVGSGLGRVGQRLARPFRLTETVVFEDIEGMGACTVAGHRGEIRLGKAGGRSVALVLGRRHFYEGEPMGMAPLMDWLAQRGIAEAVAVSTAGTVRATNLPGELVVITDIIDLQNRDTAQTRPGGSGLKTGEAGPDAVSNADSIDIGQSAVAERAAEMVRPRPSARLTGRLESAAAATGVALGRGVLACAAGPAYESPAEIRALQALGADVATMSAAPEVLFACARGLEIAVVAAITNPGTGIGAEPPNHDHVLRTADAMCDPLAELLISFARMA